MGLAQDKLNRLSPGHAPGLFLLYVYNKLPTCRELDMILLYVYKRKKQKMSEVIFENQEKNGQPDRLGDVDMNSLSIQALSKNIETSSEDIERQKKLEKGIKIVIGGPPHSGKSVFIEALMQNLDKDNTFSFSAAPDGEGPWLQRHYDDPEVTKWRQKGKFTSEFVEDRHKKIAEWDGPLMVIDVGGRTSEENARMVEGATHAIILAGDLSKVAEWREFFGRLGIEVIAKLRSDYHGIRDLQLEMGSDDTHVTSSVHHLERGEYAGDRETIQQVAGLISDMVDRNSAYIDSHEADNRNPFEIFIPEVFGDLPNETVQKTIKTRSGEEKTFQNKQMLRSAIPMIYNKALAFDGRPVWLNGPVNSWEAIALASAFDDASCEDIRLRGPDGYISTKKLDQSESLDEKWWNPVEQRGDVCGYPIYYVHNTAHASNNPVSPSDLSNMTIPEVPENAIVVISTQGPNWLKASIALGYKDRVAAVAAYIPGEGSTIAWSADKELLGEMVESLEASQDLHQKAEMLRNPYQDRLISLAQEYGDKLQQFLPNGSSLELGGSLVSRTALKGHNDVDMRLLLPAEYSSEEAIRELSSKIAEIVPYQKDRPVGSSENQKFAVMHQLDLELPDVDGPIEIELSVRPAEGYVGYARLQAEFPEEMLDQYVVYKNMTKNDKPIYKKVKEQFYAMSRALYANGYMKSDTPQEQKDQMMAIAMKKYWGPTLDDIISKETPDI